MLHHLAIDGLHCDAGNISLDGEIEKFWNENGGIAGDEKQSISLILKPLPRPRYIVGGNDVAIIFGESLLGTKLSLGEGC